MTGDNASKMKNEISHKQKAVVGGTGMTGTRRNPKTSGEELLMRGENSLEANKKRGQAAAFICAAPLDQRGAAVRRRCFTTSASEGRVREAPAGASDEVTEGRILKGMKGRPVEQQIRSFPSQISRKPAQLARCLQHS